MQKKHIEARLEDAIVEHLTTQGGYVLVDFHGGERKTDMTKRGLLIPLWVSEFIHRTQAKVWKSLVAVHGDETGKVVLDHLVKELNTKGMLKVLRQGFKCEYQYHASHLAVRDR